jgi:non-ribosomal peptide synthetase component F
MPVAQGVLVASTLDKILAELLTCAPDTPLRSLDCLSQRNLDRVCEWNDNHSIQPVERCIHDIIADRIMEQPHAEAICAWDGSLTYRELDVAAGRLAARLSRLGVRPETFVPLCFVKSVRPFFVRLPLMR